LSNSLEARVRAIEERNRKVEQDKTWETSWTRRISFAVLTYMVVTGYLFAIGDSQPFINALVPPIGFVLSTLVLKSIRNIWQK
jgi:hypothetical protein